MRTSRMSLIRIIAIATATFLVAPAASFGQAAYPTRTIKIVVPLPPGPVADVLPRMLAEKLSARWGQPIIIENRPGASLNLGAEAVAKAVPDGYTLLATPPNPLAINQSFFPKLAFDPSAFVPVSIFASLPYVLVVNQKIPVSTLQELIAYAKANPNKINFASSGPGSAPHLTGEMLNLAGAMRTVHVPYTGLGPAMTDLLAGHVDMLVDNLGNALPRVREGKLKALGVGSEARSRGIAGRPRNRGSVSRIPCDDLVCNRGAAEDPTRHRHENLAGRRGNASATRCRQAIPRSVHHAGRKLAR